MQDFDLLQVRALHNVAERSWVSGCKNHYKFVLSAGVKAKSVTTVSAEAFFDNRSFSEGCSGG